MSRYHFSHSFSHIYWELSNQMIRKLQLKMSLAMKDVPKVSLTRAMPLSVTNTKGMVSSHYFWNAEPQTFLAWRICVKCWSFSSSCMDVSNWQIQWVQPFLLPGCRVTFELYIMVLNHTSPQPQTSACNFFWEGELFGNCLHFSFSASCLLIVWCSLWANAQLNGTSKVCQKLIFCF